MVMDISTEIKTSVNVPKGSFGRHAAGKMASKRRGRVNYVVLYHRPQTVTLVLSKTMKKKFKH
jgi:hypothetical protein